MNVWLVVMPYFLFLSLTYHTDVAVTTLALCSLMGFGHNVERLRPLALAGAVVASTCMLWIRVDSAMVLAGMGLGCLLAGPVPRRASELPRLLSRIPARLWIGMMPAAAASAAPGRVAWGGLLPPAVEGRSIPVALQLEPSNLTFGLCVVGLYFAPFALQGINGTRSTWLGVAGALALFLLLPVNLDAGGRDRFRGLIRSASLVASLPAWLQRSAMAVLCVGGVLALRTIATRARWDATSLAVASFVAIALVAQASRGPVMYERYLLPINSALMVLALGARLGPAWRTIWLCGLLTLSLAHVLKQQLIIVP